MGNSRIQLRRGKAAFWADENPILHPGEPGYETDTKKLKVGDGETHWNELSYFSSFDLDPGEDGGTAMELILAHIADPTPHPVYDDGPSLFLLYENAKV
jgi:hypothetical protein